MRMRINSYRREMEDKVCMRGLSRKNTESKEKRSAKREKKKTINKMTKPTNKIGIFHLAQ
jgi:hypothetical protein